MSGASNTNFLQPIGVVPHFWKNNFLPPSFNVYTSIWCPHHRSRHLEVHSSIFIRCFQRIHSLRKLHCCTYACGYGGGEECCGNAFVTCNIFWTLFGSLFWATGRKSDQEFRPLTQLSKRSQPTSTVVIQLAHFVVTVVLLVTQIALILFSNFDNTTRLRVVVQYSTCTLHVVCYHCEKAV